ncbi:hypothetical protein PPACK8108_LOCUS2566 [Phakopsora pachyrhizi]|uniref:Uncharacterized protein n=1 Tax=Phakopsora pachyrhizi TaxID=170000 RepID=A0AAV0AM20_PHAPC|nr:hypothetical protein PPACK8108_LOCUS2566 [Phakopsora pachyrhizi]
MTSALDSDNSAVSKWGPKTRGEGKKGSLSAATSSELLEPVQSDDSTAIPVRKSRRLTSNHKVEKMLSQVDTDKEEDGEAAYFCQVQGSKRQVKLKESDLKHVPDLLRSFKSKKSESLASDMKKDIAAQHKAERLLIMEQLGKDSKNNPGRIIDPSEIPPERKQRQPDLKLVTKCPIRAAHYSCLPLSGEDYPTDLDKIADYWQRDWSCANCDELSNIELENILAWRRPTINKTSPTVPPLAPEQSIVGSLHDSPRGRDNNKIKSDIKLLSWKQPFEEAEYLCKYIDFGYSDCSWLTHLYLASRYPQRLQSFLTNGPLVDLKQLSEGHQQDDSDSDEDSVDIGDELPFNLNPDENADQKIPKAWLTQERILSIEFDDEETIEDLDENHIPKTPELMYEKMGRAFIKWQEQSYAAGKV